MSKPLFTRKALKAASTKKAIDWWRISNLPMRYEVALEDVLKGKSSKSSRVDIATLYSFMMSASELGHIHDGGLIESSLNLLAKAYTRINDGHAFRLDAISAEAVREMIPSFEMVAKNISARDYMKVCNHVPNYTKASQ